MAATALSDLRVVEYAEFISGPMCGKMFADFGAEVIKVEPPEGDVARKYPPFPNDVPHPEKSGLFLYLNTSKKGVTLNLGHPTGVRLFKELVKGADVLIENHPPGQMASLGLGYETLKELNPGLILVSVTPFGQTGPYAQWKGPDLIPFAMSLVGYNTPTPIDDVEAEFPCRPPGRQADMMGATTGAAAAMLAFFHRDFTGEGQWIDISCHEAVLNGAKGELVSYPYTGVPYNRWRGAQATPLEPQPCKDGYIWMLYTEDAHFNALREVLGNPETLQTEVFATMMGRIQNADVLRQLVWAELAKYDREFLVREGQARGLTIGPVYNITEAANHPHLAAREYFVEVDHPVAGRLKYPGALGRLSQTPASFAPAPTLGQHNEEIYCGRLDYDKEDLIRLRMAGVI